MCAARPYPTQVRIPRYYNIPLAVEDQMRLLKYQPKY